MASTLLSTARENAYEQWKERQAASPDRPRSQPDRPSALVIDLRAIDLTPCRPVASPLFVTPAPAREDEPAPPAPERSNQPRRRALLAEFGQGAQRPTPPAKPSIAAALRELNEQRVNETITEEEFKARKAELFA
jgi:hypothetical protein